jgi:hypothetical protein
MDSFFLKPRFLFEKLSEKHFNAEYQYRASQWDRSAVHLDEKALPSALVAWTWTI